MEGFGRGNTVEMGRSEAQAHSRLQESSSAGAQTATELEGFEVETMLRELAKEAAMEELGF